jgi:hypothetical protein
MTGATRGWPACRNASGTSCAAASYLTPNCSSLRRCGTVGLPLSAWNAIAKVPQSILAVYPGQTPCWPVLFLCARCSLLLLVIASRYCGQGGGVRFELEAHSDLPSNKRQV